MDRDTVYSKTAKGMMEAAGKTSLLSRDMRALLKEIDGKATVGALQAVLNRVPEAKLREALQALAKNDFIREFKPPVAPPPSAPPAEVDLDLDFTQVLPNIATIAKQAAEEAKRKAEAEALAKAEAEARAKQEAEERARAAAEKARAEAQARAKREAEEAARRAAEEKARQEALEQARLEGERRAQAAAEAARREAEEKARAEAEGLRAKLEEERRAHAAAEARAREEAERLRREAEEKARHEAEALRLKWEQERRERDEAEQRAREQAERARAAAEEAARREAEELRQRLDEERRTREEAERKAREQAEQLRREAEERTKREAEELRVRLEQEHKAREEAERRADEEHTRLQEQEKLQAEAQVRALVEEAAKRETDALRLKLEEERHAREQAERLARQQAERTRSEAEDLARREAEELRGKLEEERRVRAESEQRAHEEAERVRKDAEEAAQREADALRLKLDEERNAREESERRAREAEELRAQEEAEREKRETAERERHKAVQAVWIKTQVKTRQEAETRARKEAEDKARREAEALQGRLAEESKAREAAEARAREAARRQAQAEFGTDYDDLAKVDANALSASAGLLRSDAPDAHDALAREHAEVQAKIAAQNAETERHFAEMEKEIEAEWAASGRAGGAAGKTTAAATAADERKAPAAEAVRYPPARRVRWGKPLALLLFALLAAGVTAIHYVSLDAYIPEFEQAAGAYLRAPVKIKSLRLALVPQPHWRLEGISVGGANELTVPRANAYARIGSLFGEHKAFTTLELESPVVGEDGLAALLFAKPGSPEIKLERVIAKNGTLYSTTFILPALDASIDLGEGGRWSQISLQTPDRKTQAALKPAAAGVAIDVETHAFSLPLDAAFILQDFSAKGLIRRDGLAISAFQGRIAGGSVSGKGDLRRGEEWSLTGELAARSLEPAALAPALAEEGRLEGKANFAMRAKSYDELFAAPRVEGSFTISRGTLIGVDFARILQGGGVGGKTPFAELAGSFVREAGKTQLTQLRLTAGPVSASGNANLDSARRLSARVAVEINSPAVRAHAQLVVGGTLQEPRFSRQ